MTEQETSKIRQTLRATVEKIRKFQDRAIGEQNTKASLIEPMLEALGWDVRDPDEVHREFKPTSQDKPVDYALCLMREPRLLVEAKGLGESLSNHKWIAQVLGYATMGGIEWCILTDGNEYRFYNATARVPAAEKLFLRSNLPNAMRAKQSICWAASPRQTLRKTCSKSSGTRTSWIDGSRTLFCA